MCSTGRRRWIATAGFPIRTSSDHSLYTAPRGFSQCPTSFIGIWRQGIHRKLLVASPRDAEKSKLFYNLLSYDALYSIGKVQAVDRRLAPLMASELVLDYEHQERWSSFNSLGKVHTETRHTAGPQ
jgi:hypothetical protein